jgi:membrane associated rhomboid family serine protease
MIPISDEIRSRRVPVVTYAIIILNVLVFLYEMMLGAGVDELFMEWGLIPLQLTNPAKFPLAFVTVFSSMFLHSGWTHIIGNMLYLWIFGDNVEDALGHVTYLVFYLAAGVVAGLSQVVVSPSSPIPGIGASGAVAGVLAAYMIYYPNAPVRVLVPGYFMMRMARVPALIVLGLWFVLQLFNGFLSLGTMSLATGGVAWFAHIGGFVAGLAVGFLTRGRAVGQIDRRRFPY